MWPLSKKDGPGAESAVCIDCWGGGGRSRREIELDCVCLLAGVRAGGHKPGFRSSGAHEIWQSLMLVSSNSSEA